MNTKDEQMVDEYLEGKSTFSKSYHEADDEGCPPDIEAKILADSRKAVHARPRSLKSSRFIRTVLPIALAASLFVGIGLVTLLPQDGAEVDGEDPYQFRGGTSTDHTVQQYATPEEWLRHIQALRLEGRIEDADISLKRFKAKYPNYPTTNQQ